MGVNGTDPLGLDVNPAQPEYHHYLVNNDFINDILKKYGIDRNSQRLGVILEAGAHRLSAGGKFFDTVGEALHSAGWDDAAEIAVSELDDFCHANNVAMTEDLIRNEMFKLRNDIRFSKFFEYSVDAPVSYNIWNSGNWKGKPKWDALYEGLRPQFMQKIAGQLNTIINNKTSGKLCGQAARVLKNQIIDKTSDNIIKTVGKKAMITALGAGLFDAMTTDSALGDSQIKPWYYSSQYQNLEVNVAVIPMYDVYTAPKTAFGKAGYWLFGNEADFNNEQRICGDISIMNMLASDVMVLKQSNLTFENNFIEGSFADYRRCAVKHYSIEVLDKCP